MKIIENGNEVIVRQYEISVNVREFQKFKAGRIDRLTSHPSRVCGLKFCIRCFHTLETIYFMARSMSADIVYRDTCKVGGPQKEVVFYSVYAVHNERLESWLCPTV